MEAQRGGEDIGGDERMGHWIGREFGEKERDKHLWIVVFQAEGLPRGAGDWGEGSNWNSEKIKEDEKTVWRYSGKFMKVFINTLPNPIFIVVTCLNK